jgi:hypothetical protein
MVLCVAHERQKNVRNGDFGEANPTPIDKRKPICHNRQNANVNWLGVTLPVLGSKIVRLRSVND